MDGSSPIQVQFLFVLYSVNFEIIQLSYFVRKDNINVISFERSKLLKQ